MAKKDGVLDVFFSSTQWDESYVSVKKILKPVLIDLDQQGFLQMSDLINLDMLLDTYNVLHRMKGELKRSKTIMEQTNRGAFVCNPLVNNINSSYRLIVSILTKLGASSKDRKILTGTTTNEESPLDKILNGDVENDDLANF